MKALVEGAVVGARVNSPSITLLFIWSMFLKNV